MRRAILRPAIAALVLLASLAAARPASAGLPGGTVPGRGGGAGGGDDNADVSRIPPECRVYAAGLAADLTAGWNQLLSFAACVQDATVARITERAQVAPLSERLYDGLAPALALYLEAVEYGPPPVRLRAAYAVGMAHIALITRLRSSLVVPGDPGDSAAAARHRALRDELEPLLVRAQRTAWVAFSVVDRAAAQDPRAADDPVVACAITGARAMLRLLRDAARDQVRPPSVTGWSAP